MEPPPDKLEQIKQNASNRILGKDSVIRWKAV